MSDSIVESLRAWADREADRSCLGFLRDGERDEHRVSYSEVDRHARTIAATLGEDLKPGSRVVLLCAPGVRFVEALMGCFYAGVIAVPVSPPLPMRLEAGLMGLRKIVRDSGAEAIITCGLPPGIEDQLWGHAPELRSRKRVSVDRLDVARAELWKDPGITGRSVALIQYTSGSTGHPKGVVLRHSHLMANVHAITSGILVDPGERVVSWLPLYHDMGLIGFVMAALINGSESTFMSPLDFLQRPARWLEAISRTGAVVSGGPNFGYEICASRVSESEKVGLDLTSWRVAMSGAELVRSETIERFSQAFSDCGFDRRAFYPCYGLAEATLIVSGGVPDVPPVILDAPTSGLDGSHAGPRVGCGGVLPGIDFKIVDPDNCRPLAEGEIGEIWVRGPSVAEGYWNRPEEDQAGFRARLEGDESGPYLRTGDLGFQKGGELFIAGRLKEMLICRGRNLYPQDLERTVERADAMVRPSGIAIFSVPGTPEDGVGVAFEVRPEGNGRAKELVVSVRRQLTEAHEVPVVAVVACPPQAVPKTSSGKIRRSACRDAFFSGDLPRLAEWRTDAPGAASQTLGEVE